MPPPPPWIENGTPPAPPNQRHLPLSAQGISGELWMNACEFHDDVAICMRAHENLVSADLVHAAPASVLSKRTSL